MVGASFETLPPPQAARSPIKKKFWPARGRRRLNPLNLPQYALFALDVFVKEANRIGSALELVKRKSLCGRA
jgi:hypothetical protein